MGKITDKKLNELDKYINFYDFITFMECYTGDTKREIANYLLSHNEIIDLMTYCVNFRQDEYPFYNILANDHVVIGNLNSNYAYHFLKDLSSNGVFDNQDDYLSYYWRNEEVFNLDFLGEIGLNIERYYSHKRALQHGIELGIIDENGIEIDKPSDLKQQLAHFEAQETTNLRAQLASATDTTERQAKEIAELKAQLASIEQASNDTQSDTVSNDKLLSNVELNNLKKAVIAENNRQIATVLKDLDYQKLLSKDDLLQVIRPNMESMAKVLNGENSYKALLVVDSTIKDNHLKSLSFQTGRKTKEQTEKKSIQLIFDREKPPITEN